MKYPMHTIMEHVSEPYPLISNGYRVSMTNHNVRRHAQSSNTDVKRTGCTPTRLIRFFLYSINVRLGVQNPT